MKAQQICPGWGLAQGTLLRTSRVLALWSQDRDGTKCLGRQRKERLSQGPGTAGSLIYPRSDLGRDRRLQVAGLPV